MSYWYFMGKLVLAGVLVGALLLVCMLVYLTKKQFELYLIGLFSFLTAGYIQGLFLNGNLEILDGTASNLWNAPKIIGNLVLWVILIGAIVVFYLRKSQMIWKVIKAVSIWVILIQAVSLGVMIATSKDTAPKSDMVFTTEGMLEVGAQNNVIVFILDKFDEQYLNEILEENPEFLAPFNDFTHYTNATSEFSPTYDSIPFLLSGADFVEESTVDYVEYAYENENLLTQIHDAGYDVGVFTNKRYVPETMQEKISNYKEGVPRTCSTSDLFSLMTQCSRYKMAPFAAKQYYMYDTSDIELLVVSDEIVNIENDLPFYHQLTEEGLHISQNGSQGTFRFIHMHGGHPPYTMTEEFQYLEYDSREEAIIPNKEIMGEFENAMSVSGWPEIMRILKASDKLLKDTLNGDESRVAEGLDRAHTEAASILTYNDENSLACAIGLAYYSARKDYRFIRELPAGHGFADIVFLPLPSVKKPALIVELKYDKTAYAAIQQIKDRQYTQALEGYVGEILAVGINYDRDNVNKPHSCVIERMKKQ